MIYSSMKFRVNEVNVRESASVSFSDWSDFYLVLLFWRFCVGCYVGNLLFTLEKLFQKVDMRIKYLNDI